MNRVKQEERQEILSRLRWIFRICTPLASSSISGENSLWAPMVSTLQKLNQETVLSKIHLYSYEGALLNSFPAQKDGTLKNPPPRAYLEVSGDTIIITGPLSLEKELQGFLQIQFSSLPWEMKWTQALQTILLIGSALILITVIFTWIGINRLLIRPLRILEGELSSSHGNLDTLESSTSESLFGLGENLSHQKRVLDQLQETMEEVRRAFHSTQKEFQSVQKSSDQWNQISQECSVTSTQLGTIEKELNQFLDSSAPQIESIEELLKKSDLLTLNAFVEGNRAGAMGHGFSVVAENIRDLNLQAGDILNEFSKYWKAVETYRENLNQVLNKIQNFENGISSFHEHQHHHLTRVDQMVQDSIRHLDQLRSHLKELVSNSAELPHLQKDLSSLPGSASGTNQRLQKIQQKLRTFLYGSPGDL